VRRRPLSAAAMVALLAVAALAALPGRALADGDPASDVLLFQSVFLPYETPSPAVSGQLGGVVKAAGDGGYPIKVAVIQSPADLGSAGALFGRPQQYAIFLEKELRLKPKEKLLVVMPQGYGVAAGGSTAIVNQNGIATIVRRHPNVKPEIAVLSRLPLPRSPQPDALAVAATRAVRALAAAAGVRIPAQVPPVDVESGGGVIHNASSGGGSSSGTSEGGGDSKLPALAGGVVLVALGAAAALWLARHRSSPNR
jgi:hypothetical protein